MAISVGSVEVDVVPNTQGVYQRLRQGLEPAGSRVGDEVGRIIGRYIMAGVQGSIRDGLAAGARQAQGPAARHGNTTGSAFARGFKTRLEAAMRDLPEIRLHANSTDAEREIYQIRAQLTALRDVRIGIDVSEADAIAAMDRLRERLARLSASDANVAVRVDAGAAAAQLAAFQAELNRLDGQSVDVDVDTHTATANLNLLTTAALAFGPALIPVLPVVAAGLGAIAAAATAAGAGLGAVALVALPAFKQIGGVLQAQKAAQDAAASSTARGGQVAAQAASRSLQLASAQQAVAAAERNGARQIAQAQQQVVQARQNAAQVAAQASLRNQQAARAVEDAERSLADAQKAATQAQQDLTAARAQAAQELEDLNNRLTDSQLSQRDAEIQLKEATAQRDAVLKNANATELDKQKALLAYDQAVQRLKEQTTETSRLKQETTAANKAGVAGSQTVKAAQDQLVAAQQQVADKTRALKDAQADQARTATQNAQQIAAAQQRIADAQANVAQVQQQAAEQAASAQRQLQQAQLSAAGTADAAAVAQDKYQKALAGLTPSARGTFNAFVNLRSAFGAWSRSLQPAVMPIFTRALDGIRRALPGLTPFVLAAADAIGRLQDKASRGFKSPWWQTFKRDLQTAVVPAIVGFGVAFGNIFKGIVLIIDAFLPKMGRISDAVQRVTSKFAGWAAGLKGSPAFQQFLDYASQKGPLIADTFGKIFLALLNIGQALSPVAGPLLQMIGGLAGALSSIATYLPELVIGMWGLFVATRLWAAAQVVANAAMVAFNIISKAGPWGWIVLAIGAVVLAVIYMYRRFSWFRDIVQTVWSAIQIAALWAWRNVLQPVFSAIWTGLQTLGHWALWLWTNAIQPAFHFIAEAAKILLTALIVVVLLPIITVIKLVGLIAMWLWDHAIKPAFHAIADLAMWLYRNAIKPALGWVMDRFRDVARIGTWLWKNALSPVFHAIADGATWLYRNAIKPAFGWIADRATWLWDHGVKPAFDLLKRGVQAVGDAFSAAKDFIGKQWSKVSDLAKKPVKFVVDTVYNSAIVPLWNKVADIVDAKKLSKLDVKGWATGGVLPGYTPGRDVHTFISPTGGALALSGGEAVMRPEFTRAVGPGTVNALNAAARSGGVAGVRATLGLKDGGVIDWLTGAAKAVGRGISKGVDWVKTGADLLAHPGVIWDKLTGGIRSLIGKIGNSKFAQMVAKVPAAWLKSLKDNVVNAVTSSGGGPIGGTVPKGRRLAIISQALAAAGVPPPGTLPQWQAGLNTLITRESGWNPHAINRWDSNAKAGHPSQGLAQTIPGTFNAYVPASLRGRGILDPVANVAAAIRYIVSRYGNISNVQQANANRPPAGYDSGGWLQPGLNLAYNGTGRPEPVLTRAQWSTLERSGSDGAQQPVVVELHAKEGTLGQFIDVRVHEHQQRLVQVINAN